MSRVRVIEPGTGVVVEVESASTAAAKWEPAPSEPAPKRASDKKG